jgi:adenosylhomocysteine nucleosidase
MGMSDDSTGRHVVVLAPMPLEMKAVVAAFGLHATGPTEGAPWAGRLGNSNVTAVHIGMGPPMTRAALRRLFEETAEGRRRFDHVMIAGICGGLDPQLDVGTLINPETVVEHTSGRAYRHDPPGDAPQAGKLMTTEEATLDSEVSRRMFDEGFLGVDMESSAVAEVCEERGCPWSVYRCIGDRYFDGLLDARIVALTNPDGSGNMTGIARLLDAEPELAVKLERLSRDTSRAARLAAEAAVRGCMALDEQ